MGGGSADWGSGALPMIHGEKLPKLKRCPLRTGATFEKHIVRRPKFFEKLFRSKIVNIDVEPKNKGGKSGKSKIFFATPPTHRAPIGVARVARVANEIVNKRDLFFLY